MNNSESTTDRVTAVLIVTCGVRGRVTHEVNGRRDIVNDTLADLMRFYLSARWPVIEVRTEA